MARAVGPLLFALVLGLAAQQARAAGPSSPPARAAGAQPKSAGGGVVAVVTTDGALVLVKPDHDASVIAQYEAGKKIRVSKGTTSGAEKFRKVRVGNRIGYIADIDVRIGDAPDGVDDDGSVHARERQAKRNRKKPSAKKDQPHDEPIFFSRFVGLIIGVSEFKEDISGVDASAAMPFYGLKITGPDTILNGPVMDFNLLLHYGAPSYYDALSATKPSGFVILTDLLMHFPLTQGQNGLASFGLGPMLMFSQFTVFNGGRSQSLSELNLGLSLSLGFSYRISRVAFGLEGKYFVEKHSYRGLFATLQTQY